MRCLVKIDSKWQQEHPADLSRWLWQHDGEEAVAVDDATKTYYCGRPDMMDAYREAWTKEGKRGDRRTAAMFIDLDRLLFEKEPVLQMANELF